MLINLSVAVTNSKASATLVTAHIFFSLTSVIYFAYVFIFLVMYLYVVVIIIFVNSAR